MNSKKFDFAINDIISTSDDTTKVNRKPLATQEWVTAQIQAALNQV